MARTETDPIEVQDDEISLLDLAQVVIDNLKLLLFGPLATGLLALGISFFIAPTFTATTTFLPPSQQSSTSALSAALGSLGGLGGLASVAGIKNPADQFIAFLNSASVHDALIAQFQLQARFETDNRDQTRKALEQKVKVSAGKDGLISLNVNDTDPQFAADLANAHIAALSDLMGRLAVTESQQRRQFFEQQLNQTKEKLIQAETALAATGINASTLKSSPQAAIAGVAALKAQITAQEVQIGAMRGYLNESAPDFVQAIKQLSSLKNQLSKLERDEPASTNGAQGDYIARYREFKYQETLFELFARQYELAKVDEAREGSVIQVLDRATPPQQKIGPKKGLIAILATLAAGFALLLFVFARHAWRNASQDAATQPKLAQLKASWRAQWQRR